MTTPRKPLEPFRNYGPTVGVKWRRSPLTSLTFEGWQALAIAACALALALMGAAQVG